MSCNRYNLNYSLETLNDSIYNHLDLNRLTLAENEKLNEFINKSILFYILNELNHDVVSDFNINGLGDVEIYDFSARTAYIFELHRLNEYKMDIDELNNEHDVDVIGIDSESLPEDVHQRYMKLREYTTLG
jgi:hypothetical protein